MAGESRYQLDLAAVGDDAGADDQVSPWSPLAETHISSYRARCRTAATSVCIGVHVGADAVRMVKVRQRRRQDQLLECQCVPIPAAARRNDRAFGAFLGETVIPFAGNLRGCRIWTTLASDAVSVRPVQVPKVSPKQIPNAVYWALKREAPFDDEQNAFEFEVDGESLSGGTGRLLAATYVVPRSDIDALARRFLDAGIRLAGVTLDGSACRNLFRAGWGADTPPVVVHVTVRDDHSRINVSFEGRPLLSRSVKFGMNGLVETLAQEDGLDLDAAAARRRLLNLDNEEEQDATGISAERILEVVGPALQRLARNIERTLEYYATSLQERGISRVYASGVIAQSQVLSAAVGTHLGTEVVPLDPFVGCESRPGQVPPTLAERVLFTDAAAAALALSYRTPNLLLTQSDRAKHAGESRRSFGILTFLGVVFALCVGIELWQLRALRQSRAERGRLWRQLQGYEPAVEPESVQALVIKARSMRERYRDLSHQQLGVAVVGEVASLTPPEVRLLKLDADLGPTSAAVERERRAEQGETAGGKSNPESAPAELLPIFRDLTLDGVISGGRDTLEATLVHYVLTLEGSPLFQRTTVVTKDIEPSEQGYMLFFTVTAKVVTGY